MSEPARLSQVVAWLSDLANITAGNAPLADSKAKIGTLATMLAEKFPTEAFGRVSLDYVAQECRFFPAYADLIKHLGIWWRDHRPAQPAIAARPDWRERYNIPKPRDPPTEAQLAAVGEIMRNFKMEVGYRQSQAVMATAAPPKAPVAMTDRQLLAMHETAGNTIRAAALRAKIAADEKIVPFSAA